MLIFRESPIRNVHVLESNTLIIENEKRLSHYSVGEDWTQFGPQFIFQDQHIQACISNNEKILLFTFIDSNKCDAAWFDKDLKEIYLGEFPGPRPRIFVLGNVFVIVNREYIATSLDDFQLLKENPFKNKIQQITVLGTSHLVFWIKDDETNVHRVLTYNIYEEAFHKKFKTRENLHRVLSFQDCDDQNWIIISTDQETTIFRSGLEYDTTQALISSDLHQFIFFAGYASIGYVNSLHQPCVYHIPSGKIKTFTIACELIQPLNSHYLVVKNESHIQVLDIETEEQVKVFTLNNCNIQGIKFLLNGKLIVYWTDELVRIESFFLEK